MRVLLVVSLFVFFSCWIIVTSFRLQNALAACPNDKYIHIYSIRSLSLMLIIYIGIGVWARRRILIIAEAIKRRKFSAHVCFSDLTRNKKKNLSHTHTRTEEVFAGVVCSFLCSLQITLNKRTINAKFFHKFKANISHTHTGNDTDNIYFPYIHVIEISCDKTNVSKIRK